MIKLALSPSLLLSAAPSLRRRIVFLSAAHAFHLVDCIHFIVGICSVSQNMICPSSVWLLRMSTEGKCFKKCSNFVLTTKLPISIRLWLSDALCLELPKNERNFKWECITRNCSCTRCHRSKGRSVLCLYCFLYLLCVSGDAPEGLETVRKSNFRGCQISTCEGLVL